jgi:hypothetical protein
MRSMRLSRATGQNSQQPSVNCVEEGSIPAMQAAEVVRYVRVMRVECGFSEDLVEGPQ